MLASDGADLFVIETLGFRVDAIRHDIVHLAAKTHFAAMGEVAAVVQCSAHDGVARTQRGEVDRHVRLRTGVRLHVYILDIEETLKPFDGQILDDVDVFAAAVVAPPGIAFRILVGEHAAGSFAHGCADIVLRRDQLEIALLALLLTLDRLRDLGIDAGQYRALERPCIHDPEPFDTGAAAGPAYSSSSFTRRSCRPPSASVSSHTSRHSRTISHPVSRSAKQMTLQLLCWRDSRAE